MLAQTSTQIDQPVEKPAGWKVLGVLTSLMGFASISTDFYLPAMPEIGRSLNASSGSIELTISGFLIGFSLGQLLWGPIGDRYGRKISVALGLVLFILGSAGCAFAGDVTTMIACRILQALGACSAVVLGRAMVRDLYRGAKAAQMLSTLMTVMAVAPLIAPLVGGQILVLAGWQAIFLTLVVIGVVVLLALTTMPETLPVSRRNRESLSKAIGQYGRLVRDPKVRTYILTGGFFYLGTYAFIAGSPFAYITYFGVPSSLYGLLFGSGILAIMIFNVINSRLVVRLGVDRMMRWGTYIAAASSLILLLDTVTGFGGLWGVAVPLFFFCAGAGLITANSIGGAMADYPERAGSVSALAGAVHYGLGILGSGLVGFLADGTIVPLGIVVAVGGVGSMLCALAVPKRR